MMLRDHMIPSKVIPSRQQTVANTGSQEGQCWQLSVLSELAKWTLLPCKNAGKHNMAFQSQAEFFAVQLLSSSVYLAPEETTSQICQKIEILKFQKKRFDIFIWNAMLCLLNFTYIYNFKNNYLNKSKCKISLGRIKFRNVKLDEKIAFDLGRKVKDHCG